MLLRSDDTVLNPKFGVVILKTATCRSWTRHGQTDWLTHKVATPGIGNLITLHCAQMITYAHYVRERCNGGAYGARNVQIYYHNRFAIWKKGNFPFFYNFFDDTMVFYSLNEPPRWGDSKSVFEFLVRPMVQEIINNLWAIFAFFRKKKKGKKEEKKENAHVWAIFLKRKSHFFKGKSHFFLRKKLFFKEKDIFSKGKGFFF